MHNVYNNLIESLSKELGIKIPIIDGLAIIELNREDEIHLEFPEDGELMIIHFVIHLEITLGYGNKQLESILALDSPLDLLQYGWLNFHSITNTLRYFFTMPAQIATTDLLIKILKSTKQIKDDIINSLNSEITTD